MDAVEQLVHIEALKRLKARYFRFMDTRQWESWGECFTVEAVLGGKHRPEPLRGREAIVAGVRETLAGAVTVHHGHMPELEILDATHARGIWAMEDLLLWPLSDGNGRARLHGYGHYVEDYAVEDGEWRIANLVLTRLHIETAMHTRNFEDLP